MSSQRVPHTASPTKVESWLDWKGCPLFASGSARLAWRVYAAVVSNSAVLSTNVVVVGPSSAMISPIFELSDLKRTYFVIGQSNASQLIVSREEHWRWSIEVIVNGGNSVLQLPEMGEMEMSLLIVDPAGLFTTIFLSLYLAKSPSVASASSV